MTTKRELILNSRVTGATECPRSEHEHSEGSNAPTPALSRPDIPEDRTKRKTKYRSQPSSKTDWYNGDESYYTLQ